MFWPFNLFSATADDLKHMTILESLLKAPRFIRAPFGTSRRTVAMDRRAAAKVRAKARAKRCGHA